MAKPNYSFEKRQRELARKKKQEEKRQRKASRHESTTTPQPEEATVGQSTEPQTSKPLEGG